MFSLDQAVEEIQAADAASDAFDAYNRVLVEFGYDNACYSLMTNHPSIGLEAFHGFATSYPETWLKYYKEKDYHLIDPVYNKILDGSAAFLWRDVFKSEAAGSAPEWLRRNVSLCTKPKRLGLRTGLEYRFAINLVRFPVWVFQGVDARQPLN